MFRNQKNPYETINTLFKLSEDLINDGTGSSLIAAYKILWSLEESYPDKAFKGRIGLVKEKLKEKGLLDQIMQDEKKIKNDTSPFISTNPVKSKL